MFLKKVCVCVPSNRSRYGYSLSQMLAGVLLPRRAGALRPVSPWHFPGEGRAAGLWSLPRQWRPRACRRTKHLLLCRYFSAPGMMWNTGFEYLMCPRSGFSPCFRIQASVRRGISPATGSSLVSRALRAPISRIWDGRCASLAVEDLAPSGKVPARSMTVK